MASNPVLTLSTKGLLMGVAERLDYVYACYLGSQASQSFLYKGSVKSLQATIQEFGTEPSQLKSVIEADLTTMYMGVFDAVDVNVTVTTPATDGSNRFNIAIDLIVTDKGQTYSLGKELQSINGIVTQLLTSNNGFPP